MTQNILGGNCGLSKYVDELSNVDKLSLCTFSVVVDISSKLHYFKLYCVKKI